MSRENPTSLFFFFFLFTKFSMLNTSTLENAEQYKEKKTFHLKFYSLPRRSLYFPCRVVPSFNFFHS